MIAADRISFRPSTKFDMPFLYEVYRSTKIEELAITGWAEQEIDHFLKKQFKTQHTSYRENHQTAEFLIIQLYDREIGHLYYETKQQEVRIIDMALLPQYRNMGIGRKILTDIIKNAEANGSKVSLHVEHTNPAVSLYNALGFKKVRNRGAHALMEYSPILILSVRQPSQTTFKTLNQAH